MAYGCERGTDIRETLPLLTKPIDPFILSRNNIVLHDLPDGVGHGCVEAHSFANNLIQVWQHIKFVHSRRAA